MHRRLEWRACLFLWAMSVCLPLPADDRVSIEFASELRTLPDPTAETPAFRLRGIAHILRPIGMKELKYEIRALTSPLIEEGQQPSPLTWVAENVNERGTVPNLMVAVAVNEPDKTAPLAEIPVPRGFEPGNIIDLESLQIKLPYSAFYSKVDDKVSLLPDDTVKLWLHLTCKIQNPREGEESRQFVALAPPILIRKNADGKKFIPPKPSQEEIELTLRDENGKRIQEDDATIMLVTDKEIEASEAHGIMVLEPAAIAAAAAPRLGKQASATPTATTRFFFATNRALEADGRTFGVQPTDSLIYGHAEEEVEVVSSENPRGIPASLQASPFFANDTNASYEKLVQELTVESQPDDILIFVHGYHNTFADACTTFAEMLYELRILGFKGTGILFSWPSAGNIEDFGLDRLRAEKSAPLLARFVTSLTTQESLQKKRIHLLGHSMGARVITLAAALLQPANQGRLTDLILVAGEVGVNRLRSTRPQLQSWTRRATSYFSQNDHILQLAIDYDEAVRKFVKPAAVLDRPIGLSAIALPWHENVDCSRFSSRLFWNWGASHSYFVTSPAVRTDLAYLLRENADAKKRLTLKLQRTPQGNVWTFP